MQCDTTDADGYSIVFLAGKVELATTPQARKAILDCIAGGADLFVDLSNVEYIDSSGVASLVEGYQEARSKQQRFGLLGVSEAAMRVLELARLDKVFPIYTSLEDGLKDAS